MPINQTNNAAIAIEQNQPLINSEEKNPDTNNALESNLNRTALEQALNANLDSPDNSEVENLIKHLHAPILRIEDEESKEKLFNKATENIIKQSSRNSNNKAEAEIDQLDKKEDFMSKFLSSATYANAGINVASVGLELAGRKNKIFNPLAFGLRKLGLIATKLQVLGVASNFMKDGLAEKNLCKLVTALSQGVKLGSGFDRLLRLAGIPSAFDQIPEAMSSKISKLKFDSFAESWQSYQKAGKEILEEFKAEPIKHMLLKPSDGKHTKVLLPNAIVMAGSALISNITDTPIFGSLRKPLTMFFSGIRHLFGLHSDLSFGKDDKNPDNKKAGIVYALASAVDFAAIAASEDENKHVLHQFAALLNPIGEMFVLRGMKKEIQAV